MTPEVIEKTIVNPDFIIQLATQLKEEQLKSIALQAKVSELEPKATHYDQWINIFFCLSLNL